MPVGDFYEDFARASFGEAVAKEAGTILAQINGVHFPESAGWGDGPGNIKIVRQPWEQVKGLYSFVDELAALRPRVSTTGSLERFDYWLNTFRYASAMAEAGCCRGMLDVAMEALKAQKDPAKKKDQAAEALAIRIRLARTWEKMLTFQLAATDTPGEMGTVSNLERHNRAGSHFITAHDEALTAALGGPLPQDAQLSRLYAGPPRIIVPTVRTEAARGESLAIKVIVLDNKPAQSVTLYWRAMGKGPFQSTEVKHGGRAVYHAVLPPASEDIEYYIEARTADGKKLVWPAAAPTINQTVIVSPE